MRPFTIDVDVADVDPDGLADGNSSAGATLTLDGTLTSGGTFTSADGLGRRISILDLGADDQTGATYTFTGTNANGAAITEAILGPGASATVTTLSYFLTISSVAIASPAAGSTVDVGTVDEAESKAHPINGIGVEAATYGVTVTGTIDYDIQESLLAHDTVVSGLRWHPLSALDGKTATLASIGTKNVYWIRAIVNSHSAAAEIQVDVAQTR